MTICASMSSPLLVYLFFLVGPGPLHEIAVSAFSRSPFGRATAFSFKCIFPEPPYISLACFSSFTLFLSANISLAFFFFYFCLYPPNFSIDSISSWSPRNSFHVFSTTLSHLIPARPFVFFSHIALSGMACNSFLAYSFILLGQLSHVSFCLKWVYS